MSLHCFFYTFVNYMKVFFSIMAVYMMTVFLVPCADMFDGEAFQSKDNTEAVAHNHDHEHSDKTDLCSPFCMCNCCGTFTIAALKISFASFLQLKVTELPKLKPHYISQFIPHYFGEVWQPPQIYL